MGAHDNRIWENAIYVHTYIFLPRWLVYVTIVTLISMIDSSWCVRDGVFSYFVCMQT